MIGYRKGQAPVRSGGGQTQKLPKELVEAISQSFEEVDWIELHGFSTVKEVDSIRSKVQLYVKNKGWVVKTSIRKEPEITLNILVTDPEAEEADEEPVEPAKPEAAKPAEPAKPVKPAAK